MLANIAKTFGLSKLLPKSDSVVCDTNSPLPFNFEAARYMGTWYEIYHSKGEPFQPDSWTCNTATYSDLDEDKATFKVYNSGQGRFFGPRFGVHLSAQCPESFGQGRCEVK